MSYINRTQLYLDLIQEILNHNKDILSIDFIQTGLDGLVEENPILAKLKIDQNFQFSSELPDFSGSVDALKVFLEFLYHYMTKLISLKDVNTRFVRVGEEFIKQNSTEILRSDLLNYIPSIFFKDKDRIEKLDLTTLKNEPPINQILIIFESLFTVYLQEAFKTDDKNLFFSSFTDLKKSYPVLSQFLITKTGDVTIIPKNDNTVEQLVKDLSEVFNYFVEFSSYHLGTDLATKRAQETIKPILELLEDLPMKYGILTHLLRGSLSTRIPTGIQGFDLMIQGGIPRGNSVLIQANHGSEKNFFISYFIKHSLENNSNIIVALGQVSPKIFKIQLRTLGIDIAVYEKDERLKIIDWYSWLKGADHDKMNSKTIIPAAGDLSQLWRVFENILNEYKYIPTKCAVMNILTQALDNFKLPQVETFLKGVIQKFKDNDITALFLIDKDADNTKQLARLRALFDGVIDIENENIDGKVSSKIRILFMNGTQFNPEFKLLTMDGTKLKVS